MLMGDFESAWVQADLLKILDPGDVDRLWQGEALTGKRVVVRCLHGLGDAIQFLRYARLVKPLTGGLVVQVPPTLVPLASCIPGVAELITWDELSPGSAPAWDVQVEVMQLPYLFRSTLRTIPSPDRYIYLPEAELKQTAEAMQLREAGGRQKRIGLCWSCGEWNQSRAIPQSLFNRLTEVVPAYYYSLHPHRTDEPTRLAHSESAWIESSELGAGPLRLASIIDQLDLVITVDTFAAHLAGALGKPVWLLLQHAADWRWLHGLTHSPWYPSMRIFRQSTPNGWADVIEQVGRALSTTMSSSYANLG